MARTIAADSRSYADINMTPLIDVMLVLLIIFIITIPAQTHAVKVDNPPPAGATTRPTVVTLSIDFDGSMTWNGEPVTPVALVRFIDRAAGAPVQPEVQLRVDRFARYEIVAQTLATLQRHGLLKLGFVNVERP